MTALACAPSATTTATAAVVVHSAVRRCVYRYLTWICTGIARVYVQVYHVDEFRCVMCSTCACSCIMARVCRYIMCITCVCVSCVCVCRCVSIRVQVYYMCNCASICAYICAGISCVSGVYVCVYVCRYIVYHMYIMCAGICVYMCAGVSCVSHVCVCGYMCIYIILINYYYILLLLLLHVQVYHVYHMYMCTSICAYACAGISCVSHVCVCRYMCEGLYNWLTTTLSRANSFVVEYDMMASKY